VVNATEARQQTSLELANFARRRQGRMWRLTGSSLDAANLVGNAPQVSVAEELFNANASHLSVAPYSVEIYEFTKA
jgi:alpha-N-arabinofuranosidase